MTKDHALRTHVEKAKHVRIAELPLPVKKPTSKNDPRKIKMGKTNPLRDLLVFLGILGGLAAFFWSDETIIQTKEEHAAARAIKQAQDLALQTINTEKVKEQKELQQRELFEKLDSKRRRVPCDLFLGPSSVPGAGIGLFAGKDFAQGENVDDSLWSTFPLLIASGQFMHPTLLLLQHHPILANVHAQVIDEDVTMVNSSRQRMKLHTTSDIKAGQEIFVPFEQHPHSSNTQHPLFRDMLTPNDFRVADHILLEMIHTVRFMEVGKRKNACKMDASATFRLMHDAMASVHPRIGRLFPTSRSEFSMRPQGSTSVSTLSNFTLQRLQLMATCISDLAGDRNGLVTAKQNFREGNLITKIPMVVMTHSEATLDCFTENDTDVALCPLWIAPPVLGDGNAVYEWSDALGKVLSKDAALSSTRGYISWDLMATRNITSGEAIQVTRSAAFPHQWRTP